MEVIRLNQFKRMWKKLPAPVQEHAAKTLRQLIADRTHPSLNLKCVQGLPGYWEVRIDRDHRLICQLGKDVIVLVAIGAHEIIERLD